MLNRLLTIAAISVASFHVSSWALGAGRYESACGTVASPVQWQYCIYTTPGSANPDVIYHLHGAGEDERSWETNGAGDFMSDAWLKAGKPAPTIVSVSFGRTWLLASRNESQDSGLYEVFVNSVIPYIENRVLNGVHGKRSLFGYSMGGYNGSQLYLKNPELFHRVVLGCPALSNVSPYATRSEIDDYIRRTGAHPLYVQYMLGIVHNYYPDDGSYRLDSPLDRADKDVNPLYPPLHISCGDRDEFGFHEGALLMADLVRSKGANVTWESIPGGRHCDMNRVSVAQFLME